MVKTFVFPFYLPQKTEKGQSSYSKYLCELKFISTLLIINYVVII